MTTKKLLTLGVAAAMMLAVTSPVHSRAVEETLKSCPKETNNFVEIAAYLTLYKTTCTEDGKLSDLDEDYLEELISKKDEYALANRIDCLKNEKMKTVAAINKFCKARKFIGVK